MSASGTGRTPSAESAALRLSLAEMLGRRCHFLGHVRHILRPKSWVLLLVAGHHDRLSGREHVAHKTLDDGLDAIVATPKAREDQPVQAGYPARRARFMCNTNAWVAGVANGEDRFSVMIRSTYITTFEFASARHERPCDPGLRFGSRLPQNTSRKTGSPQA